MVTWDDAFKESGSSSSRLLAEHVQQPAIRRTVGFFIVQDNRRFVIAQDDDRGVGGYGNDDCDGVVTIPLPMVKKIVRLGEAD